MRIWIIHPKYLDQKGLVALWREALLARKVLQGRTKGWTRHPQLDKIRKHNNPVAAMNTYLLHVWKESCNRGYCFDKKKIGNKFTRKKIYISRKMFAKDISDLKKKLRKRDRKKYKELLKIEKPEPHPIFIVE